MIRHIPSSAAATHGWQVSFADLLGVLLCFFVLRYALAVPLRPAMPVPAQAAAARFTSHYLATLLRARLPTSLQVSEQSGEILIVVTAPLSDADIRLTVDALRRNDRALIVEACGRVWAQDFRRAAILSARLHQAGYEPAIHMRASQGASALVLHLQAPADGDA